MSQLIFDLDLAPPGKLMFDILGGVTQTPVTMSGDYGAVNFGGSGIVVCSYTAIEPGNTNRERLKYLSRLQALNGGVRKIVVPLLTDWISPLSDIEVASGQFSSLAGFGDGATFSDGGLYSTPTINASVNVAASLNASTIQIKILTGHELSGGEWFSINHTVQGHRAYKITDIDSIAAVAGGSVYTVGIRPNLRQAVIVGESVEFARPKCLMILRPGETVPFEIEKFWWGSFAVNFQEAPRYNA